MKLSPFEEFFTLLALKAHFAPLRITYSNIEKKRTFFCTGIQEGGEQTALDVTELSLGGNRGGDSCFDNPEEEGEEGAPEDEGVVAGDSLKDEEVFGEEEP